MERQCVSSRYWLCNHFFDRKVYGMEYMLGKTIIYDNNEDNVYPVQRIRNAIKNDYSIAEREFAFGVEFDITALK